MSFVILYIEPDRIIRTNSIILLKNKGYHVYETDNSSTGLFIAREVIPNLILLSIATDSEEEANIFHVIKNDPLFNKIPVIFITAFNKIKVVISNMRYGTDRFILTPCESADILKIVNTSVSVIEEKRKQIINN